MKLKDLVANSLPRVRGRKKKTTTSVCDTGTAAEAAVKAEISANRGSLDKGKNRLQSVSFRSDSPDDSFEMQGIGEAGWRGNALYRGLDAARAVKFNSKLMSSSYTSSHGMVTSRSAEGFSSQMVMMSRSYDSRMTVPDCSDSCPQMLSVCGTQLEPFASPQQYYHCHYHQHSHHHYHHHHHLNPKPMSALAQNQQKLYPETVGASCLSTHKVQEEEKPEQGFFRKSFASFRSMRKHSSKNHKDVKQKGTDKTVCSVCPYPETVLSSTDKKSADSKRPAKPKRKSLKVLTKQKENKEMGQSDKSWYSDNDTHSVVIPSSAGNDQGISALAARERQRDRERSVESCSSRLYGSRESSCVREVDLTGFDSASLSGYESDLPRGKVHRSRSRIKTNPWLPSPQPSLSGGGRGEKFDLRESTEDFVKLEESNGRFPRSASFEHQRSETLTMQASVKKESTENKIIQKSRSVTPSDSKIAKSLAPQAETSSNAVKPKWWTVNQESEQSVSSKKNPIPKVEVFNDLSSITVSKSRPNSTVSPNSEFVMLADNLEQLANNISFEYEEMLDTTLESVSICQEDGQTSIQGSFTDEENVEVSKTNLKSDGDLHNAHSPDSGVGGLGSTDGDENLGHNSHMLQVDMSVNGLPHAGSVGCYGNTAGSDSNLVTPVCHKVGHSLGQKSSVELKCSGFILSDSCDYNTQSASPKMKIPRDKVCILDSGSSATLSESDIDNTSYHEVSQSVLPNKKLNPAKLNGSVFPVGQHNSLSFRQESELDCSPKTAKLMVDERLDIQFQPAHRQFHGCGIVMGTGGAMHEPAQLGAAGKQVWKPSDSSTILPCRHTRPCAFKTSPGLAVLRKMNDIEKDSSQGQQRRSWTLEFDIPRNITITECVESPTENWQCVEGFSVGRGAEVLAHSQIQRSGLERKAFDPENADNSFLQDEELVVNLSSLDRYHSKGIKSCDMISQMDCSLGKLNAESEGSSSEMNDACVQTDFDEDFSSWEEADTLEQFEERALDPAESTRLWLLTGSMQDSADTGYSSLTRGSQILMDEDTLFLAGEIEESAAAERLSFVESSDRRTPTQMALKDISCRDPCRSSDCDNKYQPPETTRCSLVVDKEQTRQQSATGTKVGCEKELLPADLLSLSDISHQPTSHSPRTIPHSTVHRIFSNIESQFQEIFQKIYEDKSGTNSASKRTSSDSSDCTLKSSDTEDPEARALSKNSQDYLKSKDCETGEAKGSMPSDLSKGKDILTTPSSVSRTFQMMGEPPQSSRCSRIATETTNNKKIDFLKPKHELKSLSSTLGPFPNAIVCNHVAGSSPEPVAHERADYLEFLKDAPLDRLHLKRPLFLVPGVGPVDMSSSEQLNLFTDSSVSSKKGPLPCQAVSSLSSTSSLSPSTAHCGKKLKFKKGDHQSTSDYARSKERVIKQHNPMSSRPKNNLPNFPQHPVASFLCKDYARSSPSAQACDGRGASHETFNSYKGLNPATPKPQHPALPHLCPSSTKTPLAETRPKTAEERKQNDDAIRNMTERVICLRREQDMVFQKIQEVRQDERLRQQHQLQLRKHLHTQRKEALLETLNDLKHKLEEQSKLLQKKDDSKGDGS